MKYKSVLFGGGVVIVIMGIFLAYYVMRARIHEQAASPPVSQPAEVQSVPTEGEGEVPTVEIPTEKQRLIGVKTASVATVPLHKDIRLTGRIEYDEQKLTTINTKVDGWIERLYVDYTGRYVQKGEPLVEMYSPELLAAQQELIHLRAWDAPRTDDALDAMVASDTRDLRDAARRRLKLWDITEAQIRRIEATGTPLRTMTILSPITGYVMQKYALKGMRVMAGERLIDIADLGVVWITADVSEPDIELVRRGQSAQITLDSFPGKVFNARIAYVYPVLNAETRSARIRFSLPNPTGMFKPQMYANVEIAIDLGLRLAVPEDAVLDTGERQIVYVDRGDGSFEPREVLCGIRGDGYREVLKGLREGELVATSAVFLIDSEAQLKGVTPLPR